jgi:hypothetical protein
LRAIIYEFADPFMWHADQRAGLFLVAVVLRVALGRFVRVVRGLSLVTLSDLRVVCCFFMIPSFVLLRGLLMMLLRVARMFGRARMMLCSLLCHLNLLGFMRKVFEVRHILVPR